MTSVDIVHEAFDVRIQLLGPPRILINGQPLPFRGVSQPREHDRAAIVLVTICVDAQGPVSVAELYALIWPDKDYLASRRVDLSRARSAFTRGLAARGVPPEFAQDCLKYRRTEDRVQFNGAGACSYDVHEFEALVLSATHKTPLASLEQARCLYRGPFLEAFDVRPFSTRFEQWVERRREELAGAYHKLLHLLSLQYLTHGNWPNAISCLTPLLPAPADDQDASAKLDQTAQDYEVVCGLLMTCYTLTQRLDLARQTYTRYVQTMEKAPFSRQPAPALAKLHTRIQSETLFSTLHMEGLLADALFQIPRTEMAPSLQKVLDHVYRVTKAHSAPILSARVQEVLDRAQGEASLHGANLVGASHLALALCDTATAVPTPLQQSGATPTWVDILTSLPVDLHTIAEGIRHILGDGPVGSQPPTGCTLFHERVLQIASDLAVCTQGEVLDVLHLWIALWQEEHGLFSQVLSRYGIPRDEVLQQLEEELGL